MRQQMWTRPAWLPHVALAAAMAGVLAVGCAKFDSAAPPGEPATAKAASEQASGHYEVLIEAKEEAEPADESGAEHPSAIFRDNESEGDDVEPPAASAVAAPAAAAPPPRPRPPKSAPAPVLQGLLLEGHGGGGTVERVRSRKAAGFGKRKEKRPQEERKQQARRIVAKKTIAGEFMQAGTESKLFAASGEDGEVVVDGRFGDMDADDIGAVASGPVGKAELAKNVADGKDRLGADSRHTGKKNYKGGKRGRADKADRNGWMAEEEAVDLPDEPKPATFLPRMCYFENTYLGGNAAYLERLRRLGEAFAGDDRIYRQAKSTIAQVDSPEVHGLAVSAHLSRRSFDKAGRVYLQVGLRGSQRYGWRRPPLDIAVVVDQPALASARERVSEILLRLVRDLGAQDRVIVHVVGGGPEPFLKPAPANQLRFRIAEKLDALLAGESVPPSGLGATIDAAGAALAKLSGTTHRIPGAQIAILLVDGQRTERVGAARQAAHRLTLQGAVTSVLAVGGRQETTNHGWWQVANAGHGSYRLVEPGGEDEAVRAELDALSRVVARLIRVNVRLGPHTQAIRIIGSKVLGQQEVKRVKAREKVVDQKLSATMGLEADRGDDDDGIQTVIPYFLGGDSHIMLIELWVDGPGHIADVELRYKDLVTLANATARASVALPRYGRRDGAAEKQVQQAVRSAEVAQVLQEANFRLQRGQTVEAATILRQGQRRVGGGQQNVVLDNFATLLERNRHAKQKQRRLLNDALEVARDRQMGDAGL